MQDDGMSSSDCSSSPCFCSLCTHWHHVATVIDLGYMQLGLAIFLLFSHLLALLYCSEVHNFVRSTQPNPTQSLWCCWQDFPLVGSGLDKLFHPEIDLGWVEVSVLSNSIICMQLYILFSYSFAPDVGPTNAASDMFGTLHLYLGGFRISFLFFSQIWAQTIANHSPLSSSTPFNSPSAW